MKSVVNVGKGQIAGWTRINHTSHFAGCGARGMVVYGLAGHIRT